MWFTSQPRRPTLWKTPALVFAFGLALTLLFAQQQERAEFTRAEDEFHVEADRLGTELSNIIGERITEFAVIADYVSSVDWIDDESLDRFLAARRHADTMIPGDLGLTVSAIVAGSEGLEALEAEEQAAGRNDFSIFSAFPTVDDERIVVTHVEDDIPIMGRTLIGFDVTPFKNMLVPPDLEAATGVHARVATAADLFGGINLIGAPSNPSETEFEYEQAILYLNSRYSTADDSRTGWLTRLESLDLIVREAEVSLPDGYALVALLDGGDGSIIEIDHRSDPTDEQWNTDLVVVGSSRDQLIDLAPLRITLAGSSDLIDESRGFGNPRVWATGALASAMVALFAWMRALQSRRLADTGLELEIAQAMATTDPLTGLLNRKGLADAVESPPAAGTLLFIDIDNFKQVNDQDGHLRGDWVLRTIGERLTSLVRNDDIICRVGGDEFLIFLRSPVDQSRLDGLRNRIIEAVESVDRRISCSIGTAARAEGDETTIEELLQRSDAAMYIEKKAKPGRAPARG